MFEQERRTLTKPSRLGIEEVCADYLESLHRALAGVHTIPLETRLQRERLSIRFARKIKIGEQSIVAVERNDEIGTKQGGNSATLRGLGPR